MNYPMSMTPATNMPRSMSLFHFQTCFLDYTPSKVYHVYVVMHPTKWLPLCHFWCVFFSYRFFLSYSLFSFRGSTSKTPAIITPWLGSHPHPIFLWLYVQGTCNHYAIMLMRQFHIYFLLHCIHCFCGYMSKAPVTITPSLMRLLHMFFCFSLHHIHCFCGYTSKVAVNIGSIAPYIFHI